MSATAAAAALRSSDYRARHGAPLKRPPIILEQLQPENVPQRDLSIGMSPAIIDIAPLLAIPRLGFDGLSDPAQAFAAGACLTPELV